MKRKYAQVLHHEKESHHKITYKPNLLKHSPFQRVHSSSIISFSTFLDQELLSCFSLLFIISNLTIFFIFYFLMQFFFNFNFERRNYIKQLLILIFGGKINALYFENKKYSFNKLFYNQMMNLFCGSKFTKAKQRQVNWLVMC